MLWAAGLAAFAQTCARPGSANPLGARIGEAALREYREFNGHRIDAAGVVAQFGSAESESEWLNNPDTGEPARDRPGRFAWRRVWDYWLALDRRVPGEAMRRKVVLAPGLLAEPAAAGRVAEAPLRGLLPAVANGDATIDEALREAAVRAAINDSPWSAAFISYLMDKSGLDDAAFAYSATHADYIRRAFDEADAAYAYRACDPRTTRPKVGDLLCYARGPGALASYAAWREASSRPGFITPAHCEVVVGVDRAASKMETVGGNVLQSVALRKLRLNAAGVLSDSHRPAATAEAREETRRADCLLRATCRRQNVNSQHWDVLLQLK